MRNKIVILLFILIFIAVIPGINVFAIFVPMPYIPATRTYSIPKSDDTETEAPEENANNPSQSINTNSNVQASSQKENIQNTGKNDIQKDRETDSFSYYDGMEKETNTSVHQINDDINKFEILTGCCLILIIIIIIFSALRW